SIWPSRTMTHPTRGFGVVVYRTPCARFKAWRIQRPSSWLPWFTGRDCMRGPGPGAPPHLGQNPYRLRHVLGRTAQAGIDLAQDFDLRGLVDFLPGTIVVVRMGRPAGRQRR